MLQKKILARLATLEEQIIAWRRQLHQHPELSGQEKETAALVAAVLDANHIRHRTGVGGGHGIVAWLDSPRGNRQLALRADMDALPLEDGKKCPYASRRPGIMHACGHDGHTAVLLGLAVALAPHAAELPGPVSFIFQPAEENGCGAREILAACRPQVSTLNAIFGFHFFPGLETGIVAAPQGTVMAAADFFQLRVKGRSAHACYPEKSVDAIQVAAQLINAINFLAAKERNPSLPALVSIGTIAGGTAANIIADRVEIKGTIRTIDAEQRRDFLARFRRLLQGLTAACNAGLDLELQQLAPALVNEPRLVDFIRHLAGEVPGLEALSTTPEPVMGSEDFAYFAEQVPACYLKIGCGNREKGIEHPLHSRLFDLDEKALGLAARLLAAIVCHAQEIPSPAR